MSPSASFAAVRPAPTNDLDGFWTPFVANRRFKKAPRPVVSAKGTSRVADDGRTILGGAGGLRRVNAGHGRPPIVEAVHQVAELDAHAFQIGRPKASRLASRLTASAGDLALKMENANGGLRGAGEGRRTRFVARERGYRGAGFGGDSAGGMVASGKTFGPGVSGELE